MPGKVQTLAPTDGIKDPQVRAFCDSLANAWQLRNGNTGFDDKERFITKQEWDFLAKNPNIRALAGVGQEGATLNQPGEPGTGTAPVGAGGAFVVPLWIQNLVDFLQSGITLIDFTEFKQSQGELWTTVYRIVSQMGGSEAGLSEEIQVRADSDEALAVQLNKFWAQVGDVNPNMALVKIENGVKVNNIAAVAYQFNAVQAAVSDANGNVYSAMGEEKFNAYANANEARASASWSLKVQAVGGPGSVQAASGMIVYAGIDPNDPHTPLPGQQSAIVFNTANFLVTHPSIPLVTQAPFIVSGGQVRMNMVYIGSFIRSDIFVPPDTANPKGKGWRINSNGDAEFYGITTLQNLMSGSIFIDQYSKQWMATTAVGAWKGTAAAPQNATQTGGTLTFYGPGRHDDTNNPSQRIRVTLVDEGGNGIPLTTVVMFSGVVDHFITIWWRINGGSWQMLNTAVEPSTDGGVNPPGKGYGNTTCVWSGTMNVGYNSIIEFGMSPTNEVNQPFTPGVNQTLHFALTATMVNI